MRPEDYCDEPAEDEFGEIIKCRSGKGVGVKSRSRGDSFWCTCVWSAGHNVFSLLELDDTTMQHMQR